MDCARGWLVFATVILLTASWTRTEARTWHVLPDGSGDAPSIQAGITAAVAGDTVLVGCGTFYENWIDMKSGISLRSESGSAECVTIDAEQQGPVIICLDVDPTGSIAGFTLTGGLFQNGAGLLCENSSPVIAHCRFLGNAATTGGGLSCDQSSPTLTNCEFSDNAADAGGGLACSYSTPTISDCTFSGNWGAVVGGGMYLWHAPLTLTDVTLTDNRSDGAGGGIYWDDSDDAGLVNVNFEHNEAMMGGGLFAEDFTYLTLVGCRFTDNEAKSAGGLGCFYEPTLTDCTFTNNSATLYGGAALFGGSPTLTRCTLSGNSAEQGGALMCRGMSPSSLTTLTDCTLSGNVATTLGGAVYLGNSDFSAQLQAEDTDFLDNVARIGTDGYLEANCTAFLRCCESESYQWQGDGEVTIDDTDCGTIAERLSWGRAKTLYH